MRASQNVSITVVLIERKKLVVEKMVVEENSMTVA